MPPLVAADQTRQNWKNELRLGRVIMTKLWYNGLRQATHEASSQMKGRLPVHSAVNSIWCKKEEKSDPTLLDHEYYGNSLTPSHSNAPAKPLTLHSQIS